ncbi:MAG: glutamate 5-kinase [Omnitrophica WOR_2 bacterium RIFCSPLOWO2_12_FULL_46_30]|nr:MAG: glutamate 5-kinase [Omnitrophica WOR_2 bacterium RIFCSPHIGHO2_02_FULL_46_37]OGX43697.1 MAG: glutamate 5-kinase [Omnitrophica WOR_2 bacterium RIFCSPLOWO2_02_FULL_45_28]OGX50533.1 MAG: glutamate 5-kinase [Omnitrophica WOR_2 bacterium RIFCSPLOWO2_12_FULL_46_30]
MQSKKNFSRIVVKAGSSLISPRGGLIDPKYLSSIIQQLDGLINRGIEVVLVSSGAIACGMSVLKLKKRPQDIAGLQAAASIGQSELMGIYRRLLKKHKRICAQLLVTWEDFEDRKRYLNVRHTLTNLLKNKVLPVINENDAVATDEIRFGDNDKLSALVAALLGADLLVILSDVEGLYRLPQMQVIPVVEKITPGINRLCCNSDKEGCVGGMSSKLEAIKIAAGSGISSIIASGKSPDALLKAARGEPVGTFFLAQGASLKARERWIAYGARARGTIIVDEGAKNALIKNGKSLLSVGIISVRGNFKQNETVSIASPAGSEFARGKVNFSAGELQSRAGAAGLRRLEQEVIHRDNLVIL